MIATRCEKCKNIGCNNDNFICNSWNEEKRKEYAEQYKNPAVKAESKIKFELNQTESDTLKETLKSLIFIYGEVDELKKSFIFTPTGIGNNIKVIFRGYNDRVKLFEVEKDITDYSSW